MTPFLGMHKAESLVAFGEQGEKTAADLLQDAAVVGAELNSQLPPLAERNPHAQALMVFQKDRYSFAVGLLGCWAAGLRVALPPNLRTETISGLLAEPESLVLVHDLGVVGHFSVPQVLQGNSSVPPLPHAPVLEGVAVTALTSGSTGVSESWGKTQAQLAQEVSEWSRLFSLVPGFRAVATVPPAHLYGLLFSVLLPLVAGGSFCRDTPLHPEVVAERVLQHRADVLITVPVHLRAAQVIEPESFASLRRVFSSTAPLSDAVATAFVERHTLGITEIFGSTETGGIAWRDRATALGWQPLAGVTTGVSDAGRLVVDSPYLSAGLSRPYETADRIELLPDGSFLSLGRSDNVVKVGGYRVSLSALEEWLLQQPEISDAIVISVSQAARGARILAAVVNVAEQDNWEVGLRARLAEHFEPTTLPRRILSVHRLPRDASGKLQRYRVLRLFGLGAGGETLSRQLQASDSELVPVEDSNRGQYVVTVAVPSNYAFFVGHFDSYPVMAGAVQLQELLAPLISRERPAWGFLKGVSRVKFTGRICPGDDLKVLLEFDESECRCQFQVFRGARAVSAGRLNYCQPGSAT